MDPTTKEAGLLIPQTTVPEIDYTEKEFKYRGDLIQLFNQVRDVREMSHPEFDDMTYSQYYESNRRADLAYNPPVKNKEDRRITSGITHEKDGVLLSTLLGFNLEPNIDAFDENNSLMTGMGKQFEDMVKQSRLIEDWDKYRHLFYQEFIAQGDVFADELWIEEELPTVEYDESWNPMKLMAEFSAKKVKGKVLKFAKTELLYGPQVYLGNIKTEFIDDQDLVFTYVEVTREKAEAFFGKWERWKYVPYQVDNTAYLEPSYGTYSNFSWSLYNVGKGMVGILKYQNQRTNRVMYMCNGVMMLPTDFPLTAISPSGKITIKQGKFESMTHFAYSKSQPAKTKFDQQTVDEFLRLIIGRMQQMFKPPMGSKSKKFVNRDIFAPAKITPGIGQSEVFPLLANIPPMGQTEFSFYQLMKADIDDKTMSRIGSGMTPEGNPTATQIVQEKQAQMLKLGRAIDGMTSFERDLVWSRIYTIIKHWTEPLDFTWVKDETGKQVKKDKYRTEMVNTGLDSGRKGMKVMKFTTDPFPSVRNQMKEEDTLSKKYDKPVEITYIDPVLLANMKGWFRVNIVPTDKNNSALEKMLFVQNVQEAMQLFGPQSINMENLKVRYANKIGEDPDQFFLDNAPIESVLNNISNSAGGPGGGQFNKSTSSALGAPQRTAKAAMAT